MLRASTARTLTQAVPFQVFCGKRLRSEKDVNLQLPEALSEIDRMIRTAVLAGQSSCEYYIDQLDFLENDGSLQILLGTYLAAKLRRSGYLSRVRKVHDYDNAYSIYVRVSWID